VCKVWAQSMEGKVVIDGSGQIGCDGVGDRDRSNESSLVMVIRRCAGDLVCFETLKMGYWECVW
jgi:hypothetical protein